MHLILFLCVLVSSQAYKLADRVGLIPSLGPLYRCDSCQHGDLSVQVCDDSQRQLLMTRITIHLNQLKKLTYGKHIVARVEKLLVAGNAAAEQQVMHVFFHDVCTEPF